MIGSRLGPYEVTAKLGEGGMGEVYRATDTKLKREVAIKVLPPAFTADAERLQRFEREAQLLAQLHHPHIASIFGLEESDGIRALVMELVEGPTLAERLEPGALPLDETLSIARQIAEALEEAHEKGIVHRDLKPQNVKVTADGKVKVLDFGLAKAMDPTAPASGSASQLARSPTLTLGATVQGMILGTAGYMAPEQAKGAAVDKRADVWAFGVVLYEMLTGARLFGGDSVPETLAGVLKSEIDLDTLPVETPAALRRLLGRCLERNPKTRLRDIGEARVVLDALASGAPERESAAREPAVPTRRRPSLFLAAGVALGALGAVALLTLLRPAAPPPEPAPTVRFRIEAPGAGGSPVDARIAPDGRSVAWSADGALWVRRLDRLEARKIELPWSAPLRSWTPDGRSLVVLRRGRGKGELWRVSLDGGEPAPIGALPDAGFLWGVAPGAEGELLIGMADGGLFTLPVAGGVATPLLAAEGQENLTSPMLLPGRRGILFGEADRGRLEVLAEGRRRVVLEREGERLFDPLYSPTGHLLFRLVGGKSASGTWAVPFSLDRLEVTGEPVRILPYGHVSISDGGTIALREYRQNAGPTRLVEVDRRGGIVGAIGEPLLGMENPELSPDGTRLAVSAMSDEENRDLFVFDRRSGARYALPDDLGAERTPFWREGGRVLGFVTWNAGIRHARERNADGSGEIRLLSEEALTARESPDGRFLVFSYFGTERQESGSKAPRQRFFDESTRWLAFSPDSRWIAYSPFQASGIFLRRFPSGDGLTPVTSERAEGPRFSPDGKELFFWQGDAFVSVPLDLAGERPELGNPRTLFSAESERLESGRNYDVTADGRFVMVQRLEEASEPEKDPGIVVVQNWAAELAAASR